MSHCLVDLSSSYTQILGTRSLLPSVQPPPLPTLAPFSISPLAQSQMEGGTTAARWIQRVQFLCLFAKGSGQLADLMMAGQPNNCYGGALNGAWNYQAETIDGKGYYKKADTSTAYGVRYLYFDENINGVTDDPRCTSVGNNLWIIYKLEPNQGTQKDRDGDKNCIANALIQGGGTGPGSLAPPASRKWFFLCANGAQASATVTFTPICTSTPDFEYKYPAKWTTISTGCGNGIASQRTEVESCPGRGGCCKNKLELQTETLQQQACTTITTTVTTISATSTTFTTTSATSTTIKTTTRTTQTTLAARTSAATTKSSTTPTTKASTTPSSWATAPATASGPETTAATTPDPKMKLPGKNSEPNNKETTSNASSNAALVNTPRPTSIVDLSTPPLQTVNQTVNPKEGVGLPGGLTASVAIITTLLVFAAVIAFVCTKKKSNAAANALGEGNMFEMVPSGTPTAKGPKPIDGVYASVASNHANLYARVAPAVCEIYSEVDANPLVRLKEVLMPATLEIALIAAAAHCGDLGAVTAVALTFAGRFDMTFFEPVAVVTRLHVAAINAYTQESPLYRMMNATLGGYGNDGRKRMNDYLPYVKLLDEALKLLAPPAVHGCEPVTLFRGVKMPASRLLGGLKEGDTLTWWNFTSTTTAPDVLQSTNFLGIGKKGAAAAGGVKRTVFHIKAFNGVNIKPFSAIGDEDEVLFRPGSQFVIDGISKWHYGITEVRMHEVPSAVMPAEDYDSSGDAWVYGTPDEMYTPIGDYMVPGASSESNGINAEYAEPALHLTYSSNIAGSGGGDGNDGGSGSSVIVYSVPLEGRSGENRTYAYGSADIDGQQAVANKAMLGAGSLVYATPVKEDARRKQTLTQCARPSPSGGTCKNIPKSGKKFCKKHTCPICGSSKSSSAAGCRKHPSGTTKPKTSTIHQALQKDPKRESQATSKHSTHVKTRDTGTGRGGKGIARRQDRQQSIYLGFADSADA